MSGAKKDNGKCLEIRITFKNSAEEKKLYDFIKSQYSYSGFIKSLVHSAMVGNINTFSPLVNMQQVSPPQTTTQDTNVNTQDMENKDRREESKSTNPYCENQKKITSEQAATMPIMD